MPDRLDAPVVDRLMKLSQEALGALVAETVTICEIPAPTFEEQLRTEYVRNRMTAIALDDVTVDEIGNVVGRIRGTGEGPTLLLAAHLDTVFPSETDVTVQRDGDVMRAPGVGDNSASVAAMLIMAELIRRHALAFSGDILFAATVGEEGLGNLRGIRAVMDRYAPEVDYVIAIDGGLGSVVRQGVGSRRFRIVVTGEGGHSWGAFGTPSAIHALGRMIAGISEIRVPANPRTTFNVGTISGGTSVNTIAARAEAIIDMRSLDREELIRLEEKVRRVVTEVARTSGVASEMELLGDRPVGVIPEDHPLCQVVGEVHQRIGVKTRFFPSSTDGNVPLSMGIPAVTLGVTLGGNGHRVDEYIFTPPMAQGLGQLLLLLEASQTLPRRTR